ncbi:MAG TPA: N-acetylmuramoyl-L-alanine amidase [Prosthecobacter sp.]|nr:N-acetylmuramoyl-L-alanine amidase [Prosthecobacter sp.]
MAVRRCIVIHYTEGASGRSSIDWWKQPQNRQIDLGAHLVIDRDGSIIQCRAFNRTMSHAGVSRWKDPNTGILHKNANGYAIGIELANAGNSASVIKAARKLPGFAGVKTATHRNGGKPAEWEIFPELQVHACIEACKALVVHYHLDDITGHDCIAPERKKDPGPLFPMERLREACGFTGLPVISTAP